MNKLARFAAAGAAVVTLGIGSAVWASSSASAAPTQSIPKCTTSDLAVWVNIPGSEGAAGSSYTPLEFTNVSGHECYLWGYPGVAAVTSNLKQLGNAAARDSAYAARVVNLAPGASAHAVLRYVDVVATDPGCKAKDASYLKVYPEAQRSATETFFGLPSCTTTGKTWDYLMVTTVQPGV